MRSHDAAINHSMIDTPSPASRYRSTSRIICALSPSLISKVTGVSHLNKSKMLGLQCLDLHLREDGQGEIGKIENLDICPNLKLLNLSYNSIKVLVNHIHHVLIAYTVHYMVNTFDRPKIWSQN